MSVIEKLHAAGMMKDSYYRIADAQNLIERIKNVLCYGILHL